MIFSNFVKGDPVGWETRTNIIFVQMKLVRTHIYNCLSIANNNNQIHLMC